MKIFNPAFLKTWPRWLKIYLAVAIVTVALFYFLDAVGLIQDSPAQNEASGPSRTGGSSSATDQEFHAERARVYHESAKAAEEWNGRPLSNFEKEELWQFSRSDADSNLKEKHSYDPSEAPDH
jgi:hypothetical protein